LYRSTDLRARLCHVLACFGMFYSEKRRTTSQAVKESTR
jgi:hypothetical protein